MPQYIKSERGNRKTKPSRIARFCRNVLICANGEERHYCEADVCVCSKCETVIIHMWALLFHNSLNTSVPHRQCSKHGTQEPHINKAHYTNLAQRLSQHRIVPFSILPSAINVNTIGSKVMSVSIRTRTHTQWFLLKWTFIFPYASSSFALCPITHSTSLRLAVGKHFSLTFITRENATELTKGIPRRILRLAYWIYFISTWHDWYIPNIRVDFSHGRTTFSVEQMQKKWNY